MVRQVLWTNMGHTSYLDAVRPCIAACTFHGVTAQLVVSVRNPYSFWRSLFTYAWVGVGSALVFPRIPKVPSNPAVAQNVTTFAGFVRWGGAVHDARVSGDYRTQDYSQSVSLSAACGRPCRYDFLLRNEQLGSDWLALLTALELPLIALPQANPTGKQQNYERSIWVRKMGLPPPAVYTRELVEIVDRTEKDVFEQFGYQHEEVPS